MPLSVGSFRLSSENCVLCSSSAGILPKSILLTSQSKWHRRDSRTAKEPVQFVTAQWHLSAFQTFVQLLKATVDSVDSLATGQLLTLTTFSTLGFVCLLVGCFTSQQQASVSQGRICLDNFTCCHTEIEVADQTFYLTQSQYTDTGPTSPSADPITPGAWQGSHWSANFEVTGMSRSAKKSQRKWDSNPGSSTLEADALPLGQRGSPH